MQSADSALRRDATTALCGDVLGGCGGSSQAQGKAAAVDEPLRTAMTWNQLADRTGGAGGWEPAWPESAGSNRGEGCGRRTVPPESVQRRPRARGSRSELGRGSFP